MRANKGALGVEVRSKLHKPILVDNHHLPHVLLLCHHLQRAQKESRVRHSLSLSLVMCAWLGGQKQLFGVTYQLVVEHAERLLGKKHRRGMDFGQLLQ